MAEAEGAEVVVVSEEVAEVFGEVEEGSAEVVEGSAEGVVEVVEALLLVQEGQNSGTWKIQNQKTIYRRPLNPPNQMKCLFNQKLQQ